MKPSRTKNPNASIDVGDVFSLGNHRLLCGDCRKTDAIERFLEKESISLILTDPPYGVDYVEGKSSFSGKAKKHAAILNDQAQTDEEYRHFTKEWLEVARPFLAKKNALYIFNSDKMLFPLREGMIDAGYRFAQLLIWMKTNVVVGRMDYLPQHELIAYGWHGTHQFMKGKDKSVLIHPKPNRSTLHPTMKPVGLLRNLILNSSRIGDTVYDPFGGSGSTLLACEQTERRCLMVELSPEYCQIIIKRFEKLTGTKAKKLPSLSHAVS
jgi:DNA modification methylase